MEKVNQDFLTILSKTPNGGRPSREYYISLDMAKELSMVERNDKGRQARQPNRKQPLQAQKQPIERASRHWVYHSLPWAGKRRKTQTRVFKESGN